MALFMVDHTLVARLAKVHSLPHSQAASFSAGAPPSSIPGRKGTTACRGEAASGWRPGGPELAPALCPAAQATISEHFLGSPLPSSAP